jgi:hypothetical protein
MLYWKRCKCVSSSIAIARNSAMSISGTVAIVLVLNRLMLPLPLYQISDWVGQSSVGQRLGDTGEQVQR